MSKFVVLWREKILPRLKSPVVLATLLAQIVLIIAYFNSWLSGLVRVIGTAVIEILTVFGLLNNPDNKSGF